jgi:hypothetical protein
MRRLAVCSGLRPCILTREEQFTTMCRTRASSHRLASALTSRLSLIIPATMEVRRDGANVVLLVDEREIGGSAAAVILDDDDDRDLADRARTAVEAVLNGVQDVVIEELKEGWPTAPTGVGLPLPGARAVGGSVLGWYGSEDTPVVQLDPIPLSELIE